MKILDKIIATVKDALFPCRHPYAEAHVELYPELEYVRYYRKCPDCDVEWDE